MTGPRVYPMRIALIALAIGLVACAGPSTGNTSSAAMVATAPAVTSSSPPPATPSGSPQPTTFASDIYGYSIDDPAGWLIQPALRQLKAGEIPFLAQTASDRFTRNPATDTNPLMTIAAQPVSDTMGLERWGAYTVKIGSPHAECAPSRQETSRVGGEPALLYIYECSGFLFWTALVHDNLGYDIVLLDGPADNEATDRAVYDRLLATVGFTR
jgi:hypothetical protein